MFLYNGRMFLKNSKHIKKFVSENYCQRKHNFRSLTSGRTPVFLLDGKRGIDPSSGLSTVVKQILYS